MANEVGQSSRDWLIAEAEEAREAAMRDGQYSAAVAAIKEKGVLSGKRVERAEHGAAGEFDWIDNLSADELRELINNALQDGVASGDVAVVAPTSGTEH